MRPPHRGPLVKAAAIAIPLLVAGAAPLGLAAAPPPLGEQDQVRWQGAVRHIAVYRPASAAAGAPLLLVLGEPGRSARYALGSWREVADLEGVAVVAVSSSSRAAWREAHDGAGFLRAVVQRAGARRSIDPRRVYLFGVGPGGGFAVAVAMSQPRYFAAVASLDGDPGPAVPGGVERLVRPLPVRLFHSKRLLQFDVEALHQAGVALRRSGAEVEVRRLDLAASFERKGRKVAGRIWAALASQALSEPPRYERTPWDR